jgi:hypothetical protein
VDYLSEEAKLGGSQAMTRSNAIIAAAVAMSVVGPAVAQAQTPRPRLVAPVRGEAVVDHLPPVTRVEGEEVVTTWKLKNRSSAPIAGLKIEEFWYDSTNNLVPGDSETIRTPIQPGAVITVVLRTPRDARMTRNQYRLSHQNGTVKTQLVKVLEEDE